MMRTWLERHYHAWFWPSFALSFVLGGAIGFMKFGVGLFSSVMAVFLSVLILVFSILCMARLNLYLKRRRR